MPTERSGAAKISQDVQQTSPEAHEVDQVQR
jgi:hypothetical protein